MAVFSTIGNVLSSKSNRKAATVAADTSLEVADKNIALADRIYEKNALALAPASDQLGLSTNIMAGALGYGDQQAYRNAFADYLGSSDYAFQFGEGANALNSGYAAGNVLQSGAAMKDLERYRQDLQSGYRGEFNNLLGNQQALGLSGASALAGVGQNYTNTVSANNTNAGNAVANAALIRGANNPWAAGLNTLGQSAQQVAGFALGGGF